MTGTTGRIDITVTGELAEADERSFPVNKWQ